MATTGFETSTVQPIYKREGRTTRIIEKQTSKLPSGTFLTLAIGSIGASAWLMATGRKQLASFVGQWAPTLLILGLYNKMVKIEDELLWERSTRER